MNTGVNGGGHPGAAGTTIMKDLKHAQLDLIDSIEKLYAEEINKCS